MAAEFIKTLLSSFVAFIALVNPVQKIFVIHSLQRQFDGKTTRFISVKSTLTALIILVAFLAAGHVIFNYVFHIELYAFQMTCGIVLFYNGLTGLQRGVFFKMDKNISAKDLTVPIAIPMIAGPATITAAVTFPADYGNGVTVIAIVAALAVNLVFMLAAKKSGCSHHVQPDESADPHFRIDCRDDRPPDGPERNPRLYPPDDGEG